MKIQVYRDGRVIIDGIVIAHTNNPQEVLRRLLASRNSELVLDGRACCFPGLSDLVRARLGRLATNTPAPARPQPLLEPGRHRGDRQQDLPCQGSNGRLTSLPLGAAIGSACLVSPVGVGRQVFR